MKIVAIENFSADAGFRNASYLKITTDEGIVGWSEYPERTVNGPLTKVIHHFGKQIIGRDPRPVGQISSVLHTTTYHAFGGLNHLAIAAIENALLDIAGKVQGVPVYALFGGPFRTKLDLYWTHLGSYRVFNAPFFASLGLPPIETLDDFKALAREAVSLGFKAVKTNPVTFGAPGEPPRGFNGGWRVEPGDLFVERNPSRRFIRGIVEQLEAIRDGLGEDAGLMIDLAFNQRTEGLLQIARAVEPLNLTWLEVENKDPGALADLRRGTTTPIASLETLFGISEFRPFIEGRSIDVSIIDVNYNGVWQSVRIATLADAYEYNIAPHNPLGDLATLQSAHFSAAIPNFRILEYRWDEAPWIKSFVTHPVEVRDGQLHLSDRPGWGADVDEEALRAYPPKEHRR